MVVKKAKKLIYVDLHYLDKNKDTDSEYAANLIHKGKMYSDIYITNIGRIYTTNPDYIIESESFHRSKSMFWIFHRTNSPLHQEPPFIEERLSNAIRTSFKVREYRRINYRLRVKRDFPQRITNVKLISSLINQLQVHLCDNYKEDINGLKECEWFLDSYLNCDCKRKDYAEYSKEELISFLHGAYVRHKMLYQNGFGSRSYKEGIEDFKKHCQIHYDFPGLSDGYHFTLYYLPKFNLMRYTNTLKLTESFSLAAKDPGGDLESITRAEIVFPDILNPKLEVTLHVYGYKAVVEDLSSYYRVVPPFYNPNKRGS